MKDDPIDFSDLQESTDAEPRRTRRVGRLRSGKAKQLIAIRIFQASFQTLPPVAKQDKPYKTLIHELLEEEARKS